MRKEMLFISGRNLSWMKTSVSSFWRETWIVGPANRGREENGGAVIASDGGAMGNDGGEETDHRVQENDAGLESDGGAMETCDGRLRILCGEGIFPLEGTCPSCPRDHHGWEICGPWGAPGGICDDFPAAGREALGRGLR